MRRRSPPLKAEGAKHVLVYGIGRMCHIAFWEPHFAEEFETEEEWKANSPMPPRREAPPSHHRAECHHLLPVLVAAHSLPCQHHWPEDPLCSDYAIGGADGALARGMQWQGMCLWMTLRHGPAKW